MSFSYDNDATPGCIRRGGVIGGVSDLIADGTIPVRASAELVASDGPPPCLHCRELEAKLMEYVERNAQHRDSVVRMRERLKEQERELLMLRELVVELEDARVLDGARREGMETSYQSVIELLVRHQSQS